MSEALGLGKALTECTAELGELIRNRFARVRIRDRARDRERDSLRIDETVIGAELNLDL